MEVFITGLPHTLADQQLKRELKPFMNVLGIVDWAVEKPRRKEFGWISFLYAVDGTRFLERHGTVSVPNNGAHHLTSLLQSHLRLRPGQQAQLYILSKAIRVFESNRNITPLTLSHLRHEQQYRKNVARQGHRATAISCALAGVSCGKLSIIPKTNQTVYAEQTRLDMAGKARFSRRCLTIHLGEDIQMDIGFDIIEELIVYHNSRDIILILGEPPRFFSRMSRGPKDSSSVKWERRTSCPEWNDHAKFVAHCLVYQLMLQDDPHATTQALKEQDNLSFSQQGELLSASENLNNNYLIRQFESKLQSFGSARATAIKFPILYQVQALVWNNYLDPQRGLILLDLLERKAKECEAAGRPFPVTVDSMKRHLHRIPYPTTGTTAADLDPANIVQRIIEDELELRRRDPSRKGLYGSVLKPNRTWVFKALVTPTRITLLGPDAESKNRVLRMFEAHSHHFLRVVFCDEDGQDLPFNARINYDTIYERYRNVMADGIRIAGRHFSFLGFSHSSLRSHSVWFLAPFIDANMQRQDHDTITKTLGDFSSIRIPAKCAARIGQAFSETPYAVNVLKSDIKIRYIEDVRSEDGARVFSDGVGTISWDAVEEFWDVLPMRLARPTCFQIRWGGIKGMLSLDSRLTGKVICVRKESMMKFPSDDMMEVGICDAAVRPFRLVLNRQLIKILEDMGTNPAWFVAMQDKALDHLKSVTSSPVNTSAFLKDQDIGGAVGLPSFIRRLDTMGIDYRRDRFLKSVVEHAVLHDLRLLKHKARIPVQKGVTLFGVMDETGFLQEGEVFVTFEQVHNESGALMDTSLRDGPVIVTRCPALHPGDVQLAEMKSPSSTDHPLRHLKNCIVFSQKGSRDLPSQLSGGDLDGDTFLVIWDEDARPKARFEPADYLRATPPVLDREVTRSDIAEFFINFMRSDILGLIANRHAILADVRDEGTQHQDCLKLAEMHSVAVDYSKTGIAVNWTEMPKSPPTRPDFLSPAAPINALDLGQLDHVLLGNLPWEEEDENDGGRGVARPRYHLSEKILGKLYRGIDEEKIWSQHIHQAVSSDGPSVWDQLVGLLGAEMDRQGIDRHDSFSKQEAWKIRNLYEDAVSDSMWHFSDNPRRCITEVEVFCGSILNFKKGMLSRQQRDSSIRLKEDTDRTLTWITKLIRVRTDDAPNVGHDGNDEDGPKDDKFIDPVRKAIQLSWACLVVGGETSGDAAVYRGTGELQSFRVVAATCLLKEITTLETRTQWLLKHKRARLTTSA